MEDIIKMVMAIVAALGLAAIGVYAVAFVAAGVVTVVGSLASGVASAAPAALCVGGAALVASRQGY